MRKYCSLMALLAVFPVCAVAQQAEPLAFEVASVKQTPNHMLTPEDVRAGRNLPHTRIEGDRVDIGSITMRVILGTAYGVAGALTPRCFVR